MNMKKKKLINFINKYSLGGLCNHVRVKNTKDRLATTFTTDGKDVLGFVICNDISLSDDDLEFGIFNTDTLLKMLNVAQDDIEVSFDREQEGGKEVLTNLNIKDDVYSSKVMLAALNVIEKTPEINEVPPTDVKIEINPVIINQFNKARNVIADTERFAFVQNGDKVDLIINYADHNIDTVTLTLDAQIVGSDLEEPLLFHIDRFSSILTANQDCETGIIELSPAGLMTLKFKGADFQTKYLQVMLTQTH